jgi:hypothetical protein
MVKDKEEVEYSTLKEQIRTNDALANLRDVVRKGIDVLCEKLDWSNQLLKDILAQLSSPTTAANLMKQTDRAMRKDDKPIAELPEEKPKKGGFVADMIAKAVQYKGTVKVSEKQMAIIEKIRLQDPDPFEGITFKLWD